MSPTYFLLSGILSLSIGARILCVFPIPAISHLTFHQTMCKELSLKGHHVTVLTPEPLNDNRLINLTEVRIFNLSEMITKFKKTVMMSKNRFELNIWSYLFNKYAGLVEETIAQLEVIFSKKETNFDLVVVEALHPLIYSIGCRFKTPVVALSSSILSRFTLEAIGNTQHPLVYYELLGNMNTELGLYEKVSRIFNYVLSKMYYHWFVMPELDKTSKHYFGAECTYIEKIHKNVSLVVANINPILTSVYPSVPAVTGIGGIALTRPQKPLSQDLQTYLDQSTQGVVYFSLGSNVKTSVLPKALIGIIVEALAELPFNVLLKWETDFFPDKPKNVMIKKWFPQQDILAHKNIKVFVTHGGALSIGEGIANCVPFVAIPFYLDQPFNVVQLIKLGIGQGLDYSTLTKKSLKVAIKEVAGDKKYKERIKEIKSLIQDQPMQNLDKAMWWMEYIVRQKGAQFLKSVSINVSWWEYLMFDLVAVVATFISFIYICFCLLLK